LEEFKPDLLPVCAVCRSTSLEEQAMPAHPTLVGNPWLSRENGLNDFDIIKLSQKYNYNNKVMAVITGRIAALRQTAGIKFTRRPKICIFAPHGRLVAPIQVKFGTF